MTMEPVRVLDLQFGSDRVSFAATPQPVVAPGDARTFDIVIEAQAHPFGGRVHDVALADDLQLFAGALDRMTVPGSVIFGGERMVELALSVEPQTGGDPGRLAVEISLTGPSGDPWPRMTMLLFDQGPFWADAARIIHALLD